MKSASLAPLSWLARAWRFSGREREGLVQSAKMAVAAVLAWGVARQLIPSQSFIAPYAAVFLVSETVYRSLLTAAQQTAAVTLGVLLAFAGNSVVPQPMAAMGIVVFVGMVIGLWPRLGGSGVWVGVTGLLMLALGAADEQGYLLVRVAESVMGAAIGAAVNLTVLPPIHLKHTHRAVRGLSGEIRELLSSVARGLRADWGGGEAQSWLRRARRLQDSVSLARDAAHQGRESTRWNPRWALTWRQRTEHPPARYESAIQALHEVASQTERIAESLAWLAPAQQAGVRAERRFDPEFAELLDQVAIATAEYEQPLDGENDAAARRLSHVLRAAREEHTALAARFRARPGPTDRSPGAESALLQAAERAARCLIDDLGVR